VVGAQSTSAGFVATTKNGECRPGHFVVRYHGVVEFKVDVVYGDGKPIDLETGEIGLHSTPTIVHDVVLVGSAMKEGMTVTTHNNEGAGVRIRCQDRETEVDLQHDSSPPNRAAIPG
jgi:hypothetical protein